MNGRVAVREVATRADRRRFQRLPWSIYAGDANWVAPLLNNERELLGWGRHPFHDHADCTSFLAEDGRSGEPLGRLTVLVNHVYNSHHAEDRGFFGFFECVDDDAVARMLFERAESWLRERGATHLRGPVNPSLNYTGGLLVEGNGAPPRFMMTYNPPYYARLLESCGFAPAQNLLAYEADRDRLRELSQRYSRAIESAQSRSDVVIRPMRPKRFQEDLKAFLDIYNRSLHGTWGFAPLQPREVARMAAEMRWLIIPRFAMFAEVAGKPVGAVLALPDYNEVLRGLNGRLFPFGLVRLLRARRSISTVRTLAMTMTPDYRYSGLAVVLMHSLLEPTFDWGVRRWELSWILESNSRARRPLEKCGMEVTRRYRLYDKPL